MKRHAWKTVVVIGLCVLFWFAWLGPFVVRWKQNNASVVMLAVKNDLERHVKEKGEWPRSWEELYPQGATRMRNDSRIVEINWQASLPDIFSFLEVIDPAMRHESFPPDEIVLPVLVRFTDNVPRNADLAKSERTWNWWISIDIYRDRNLKTTK